MKFVFLLYFSRSGSTMFSRHISSHSHDLVVLPEFKLLELLLMEGEGNIKKMDAEQLLRVFRLDHQIDNLRFTETELRTIAEDNCGKGIRALMEDISLLYARKNHREPRFVLFKRGTVLPFYARLIQVFPEARFIHCFRDPRGAINSMIHTVDPYSKRIMGRGDVYYLARYWKSYVAKISELKLKSNMDVMDVRYEDICIYTLDVVQAVIDYIGASYKSEPLTDGFGIGDKEKTLHGLINRDPLLERMEAWKYELPVWQGITVERIAGDYLELSNYMKWFDTYVSRWATPFCLIYAFLVHMFSLTLYSFRRILYYARNPSYVWFRLLYESAKRKPDRGRI